jgi:hypothetical protein
MDYPLLQEFDWYLENQSEMVAKYNGKVIVIKDRTVLYVVYDDELAAITETQKRYGYEIGTFLVMRVSPGDAAYSQTFHSRVGFG